MIIANPIYDIVFKYLLEDLDISRELPQSNQERRTRLEHVLQLFDQTQKLPKDRHKLEYVEDPNNNDALIRKIKERLLRAVADEELRLKMRIEDELERTYYKDLRAKDEIIEQKDEIILEQVQVIVETKQELQQTKLELEQKEQELARLRLLLEQKNK